jgi:hypothetical protein
MFFPSIMLNITVECTAFSLNIEVVSTSVLSLLIDVSLYFLQSLQADAGITG